MKSKTENTTALKKRIFDIIQIGELDDMPSRLFDFFIITAILLNITVLFLKTFDSLLKFTTLFEAVEYATTAIFIIEYALRLWTANFLYKEASPMIARIKFIISFNGIVDLLTILPMFFLEGFVVFRMLRVVRILRLFRINAYYDSFYVIRDVVLKKKNQLTSSFFIIFVLMLASSLCIYSAENEAQPDVFQNAFSGIWWSISTLLTVGYGDIYPVTTVGRLMGITIGFLGVLSVAIPTGIISAGFVEEYTRLSNPLNDQTLHLEELIVNLDSSWVGKQVRNIERDSDIRILLLYRDGERVHAKAKDIIQLDDVVVFERAPAETPSDKT